MPGITATDSIARQVSYALSVQILVDQKLISDPEKLVSEKQKQTTNEAAAHAVEQFERASLVAEVKSLTDGHGFLYGVGQAFAAALLYSVFLVIVATIVHENGIDIVSALKSSK